MPEAFRVIVRLSFTGRRWRVAMKCALLILAMCLTPGVTNAANPTSALGDFASVYQRTKPSVVYIVVATQSGAQSGSGFIYDSDSAHTIIATADHVIAGGQRIDVIFDSNVKHRYHATVLEHDRHADVAFLDVPLGGRNALRLMERAQINEGSAVAAIGYPRAAKAFETVVGDDLRPSVHGGMISAVRVNGEILQVDAQIDHGDSGGPVVDMKSGRVVGIVDASLLDASFAIRGLEKPLPGSSYAISAPTIYAVRNGLMTGAAPVAATDKLAGSPDASVQSSSAYRVAFVTASFSNSTQQAIESAFTQRVREHFTSDNKFYPIAAPGFSYTESSKVTKYCDENRVNAVVLPYFGFSADAAQAGNATVSGTLLVVDCAGVPYYIGTKTKRESRLFNNRGAVREIVDMGNDIVDRLLSDFETFRQSHLAAWDSLLKAGIASDPTSSHMPVSVGVLYQDHQYRVAFLREEGRGAKSGLQPGDVIVSIDGAGVTPETKPFGVSQLLESAKVVVVRRPDGDKALQILQ
jgi:S1-C subfamily serine protease